MITLIVVHSNPYGILTKVVKVEDDSFYNDGSTPEEFVEWNGDKYNLIKFD
jgi:hypothetical protein